MEVHELEKLACTNIEKWMANAASSLGRGYVSAHEKDKFENALKIAQTWVEILKASRTLEIDDATMQAVEAIRRASAK